MNGVSSEIAQLEHELELLRSRRALFLRGAKMLKIAVYVFVAVMAILFVYAVNVGNSEAIRASALILLVSAPAAILVRNTRWENFTYRRSMLFSPRVLESEIVAAQIAEREQRLAELRATP
jgi:hypothetical protein